MTPGQPVSGSPYKGGDIPTLAEVDVDDRISRAVAIFDTWLALSVDRQTFSRIEVSNMLLDLRILVRTGTVEGHAESR